jgi:hypothetical protein
MTPECAYLILDYYHGWNHWLLGVVLPAITLCYSNLPLDLCLHLFLHLGNLVIQNGPRQDFTIWYYAPTGPFVHKEACFGIIHRSPCPTVCNKELAKIVAKFFLDIIIIGWSIAIADTGGHACAFQGSGSQGNLTMALCAWWGLNFIW